MKYYLNEPSEEMFEKFIKTNEPIYFFNILLNYFNLSMNVMYGPMNLFEAFEYCSVNTSKIKDDDYTYYFSLDISSNIKLARYFLSLPWEEWDNKDIFEVGCGFGLYTHFFNLIKDYYKLNTKIYSYDFVRTKIRKLRKIELLLGWSNNIILCKDCIKFRDFKDKDIALLYSETFSSKAALKEDYFRIMKNIISQDINIHDKIFPREFIISGKQYTTKEYLLNLNKDDVIESVKIGNEMCSLSEFRCDDELEIYNYMKNEFEYKNVFGFRWGF